MTASRYAITGHDTGFLVKLRPHPFEEQQGIEPWLIDLARESRPERQPVTVTSDGYSLTVQPDQYSSRLPSGPLNLVDYYSLCDKIAVGLMAGWKPPDDPYADDESVDRGPPERWQWYHADNWAVRRTASSVNKMLYDRWKALVAAADPTVVQVQKKVFAAAFGYGPVQLVQRPAFYRQPFVVKDVLNYRAAAVATLFVDRWMKEPNEALAALADWKGLYSPDGTSYRTLNKTLMNLPAGVSPKVLKNLRRFILPRPITDRLELITVCCANGITRGHPHVRVLSFAQAGEIREAMRRLSADRGQPLSPRRWRHVKDFVQYVADYPEPHRGNVVTLADKAIRYHREEMRSVGEQTVAKLGHDAATATPPVPLPKTPGVRFLATVGQLVEEGEAMKNCIATYADRAVKGNCYLFHVDHGGEAASVEVDWYGHVLQASGPNNTRNGAADWGRQVLGQWGKRLRSGVPTNGV